MEVIDLFAALAGVTGVVVQILILRDWMQINKYLKEQNVKRVREIDEAKTAREIE